MYAPFSISPFLNGRFSANWSPLYRLLVREAQSLMASCRPREVLGRGAAAAGDAVRCSSGRRSRRRSPCRRTPFDGDVAGQPALNGDVPLLDRAAVDLFGLGERM